VAVDPVAGTPERTWATWRSGGPPKNPSNYERNSQRFKSIKGSKLNEQKATNNREGKKERQKKEKLSFNHQQPQVIK
jgi:hypothetical protein